MREIKFRGRYSPDHDWVYGDYYKYYDGSFMHVITYIDDSLMQNTLCPIDIDSLGQFTGLHDKHGVEIYEGDILQCYHNGLRIGALETVEFKNGGFWLRRRDVSIHHWLTLIDDDTDIEIIGNIHSTPSLTEITITKPIIE